VGDLEILGGDKLLGTLENPESYLLLMEKSKVHPTGKCRLRGHLEIFV